MAERSFSLRSVSCVLTHCLTHKFHPSLHHLLRHSNGSTHLEPVFHRLSRTSLWIKSPPMHTNGYQPTWSHCKATFPHAHGKLGSSVGVRLTIVTAFFVLRETWEKTLDVWDRGLHDSKRFRVTHPYAITISAANSTPTIPPPTISMLSASVWANLFASWRRFCDGWKKMTQSVG